ncbi:gliding motility-associated C-terminal domain-containing protein [Flavobacterium sp. PL02]|uniref:gliding motility-associated C-terminal domain-containing protein n=1 Tax=Flavobacterium sp. PL02 TaxID=3088354 RepID=UPI002B224475|nr:gliding motility-associated C-terminal domain-containing protein [Flavobacterium sp. PL02]MEA9414246.1 gliding motility-associated C-terminal domain-containing protein [Flavobacterium sp. PL02]
MTKIYIKAILSILFIGKLSAQTVNTGEISILSGTEFATVSDFDNKSTGDFINDGQFIVYSNYNNDGLVTFSPKMTSGLTYFKGSDVAQTISGKELSEFNNVRFENRMIQPAFLLSGAISVYGISDFYKGIVSNTTLGGNFTFEYDATHNNTNDDSYVDGYVHRNGSNEFEFPIGDGGFFRPSAINQTNSTKNQFVSKYLFKNSNGLYPHLKKDELITAIDSQEYWEFESNQSTVDVALTLSWNTNTTPSEILNEDPDTSLAIASWDDSESKWKFYTSAVNLQNQTVTAAIDKSGVYTLARVKVPTVDDIVIYNALSPNGDGHNDYFNITGLEKFSDNSLEIYNRYGIKVFETVQYGFNENWFRGISEGRVTVNKGEGLPTGTYFYVLKFKMSNGGYKNKTGYLYISNN